MGKGTAAPAAPMAPTIIPGMQSSNYLSPVKPPLRVRPAQLAPMSAFTNETPPSIAATPNGYSPSSNTDPIYGSGNNNKQFNDFEDQTNWRYVL